MLFRGLARRVLYITMELSLRLGDKREGTDLSLAKGGVMNGLGWVVEQAM